jgi:hypothetical protein
MLGPLPVQFIVKHSLPAICDNEVACERMKSYQPSIVCSIEDKKEFLDRPRISRKNAFRAG